MPTIQELHEALLFFSKIADEENVPVGITVSMDGKFGIKYSLAASVRFCACLDHAAMIIIEEYKERAGLVYQFQPILRSEGVKRGADNERFSLIAKISGLF